MAMTKDQILAEAMSLEPKDREALAEEILLSLGPDEQGEIDAAWLAEAHRREADFARAGGKTSPVEDVIGRLEAKARR